MTIYEPEITLRNDRVYAAASFQIGTKPSHDFDRLWFSFPKEYARFLTDRVDGFIVALLPVAMRLGRSVHAKGTLSPKLREGIEEFQRFFSSWFSEEFNRVAVTCDSLQVQETDENRNFSGAAFSGGVDSFYTLWAHIITDDMNAERRITHCCFVHGFDIPLAESYKYNSLMKAYRLMLHSLGLELLDIKTNVRELERYVGWNYLHGCALIACAVILGSFFQRFYVPSSKTYGTLEPWGSDPRTDPLMSTETLQIIHHGAHHSRVEKTTTIAGWSAVQSHLRVCWDEQAGLQNCCRCNNCIRTMISLKLSGKLSCCSTFPRPLRRRFIRNCGFKTRHEVLCGRQMIRLAYARGLPGIAVDVRIALSKSRIVSRIHETLKTLTTSRFPARWSLFRWCIKRLQKYGIITNVKS